MDEPRTGETKIADITYVPRWVDEDITVDDVRAIIQGGCASGAYMPAVTYYDAYETMHLHGDAVLLYIENNYGDLPPIPEDTSWRGIAVHYLSTAVELWALSLEDEMENIE